MTKKNPFYAIVMAVVLLATGFATGFPSGFIAGFFSGLSYWEMHNAPDSVRVEPAPLPSVHVAANLPLTGPLATYGVAVKEGASMALDEISNDQSPETSKIVIDWQDNAGDPKLAVNILRKQLENTPAIYVSGVKPQTMAIKDEISQQNIPHFVWTFDAYINQQTNNNFRTWVSYKIEPPIYLSYAKQRAAKR